MREKGFTLIELLAVLVILGVIALITFPIINNMLTEQDVKLFKTSMEGIVRSIETDVANNGFRKESTYSFDGDKLFLTHNNGVLLQEPLEVKTGGKIEGGKGTFTVLANGEIYGNVFNGIYCATSKPVPKEVVITNGVCGKLNIPFVAYKEVVLNGADPVLKDSMIPIYFDGNVAKKAHTKDKWYSYADKKWANAVLVKDNGTKTRQAYINAVAGTIINETDVLAYLVWIPRYKYKLFNVEQAANTTPSQIEIVFESRTTPKSNGTTNGSYLTAPGFTLDTEESSGIWMGKFETTGDATTPTIKPNVTSFRGQNVSSFFNTNQKFNNNVTYGLTSGTRMARNTDWTVAAYLSRSVYGINEEVRINNNNGFITGCGANVANASWVSTCDIAYGQAMTGIYPQSTTGNITGIFDMSGGAWEYVMGVLADSSGNPRSGYDLGYNSGYNGMYGDDSMKTDGLAFPESKYYDLYMASNSNSCGGGKCLGHSLGETAGWYGDHVGYVNSSYPWFSRGGSHSDTSNAGVFYFHGNGGNASGSVASRLVLSQK